jgi:hypothetical protein
MTFHPTISEPIWPHAVVLTRHVLPIFLVELGRELLIALFVTGAVLIAMLSLMGGKADLPKR